MINGLIRAYIDTMIIPPYTRAGHDISYVDHGKFICVTFGPKKKQRSVPFLYSSKLLNPKFWKKLLTDIEFIIPFDMVAYPDDIMEMYGVDDRWAKK